MLADSLLIDQRVLAILPVYSMEFRSEIVMVEGVFFSKHSALELIESACIRNFSSMEGRRQASIKLLQYYHKTPFIISPFQVGVFPTISHEHPDCIWIFNHRFEVEEIGKKQCKLTFFNGNTIEVPISKHTILKQKHRLHTLLSMTHTMFRERELLF